METCSRCLGLEKTIEWINAIFKKSYHFSINSIVQGLMISTSLLYVICISKYNLKLKLIKISTAWNSIFLFQQPHFSCSIDLCGYQIWDIAILAKSPIGQILHKIYTYIFFVKSIKGGEGRRFQCGLVVVSNFHSTMRHSFTPIRTGRKMIELCLKKWKPSDMLIF